MLSTQEVKILQTKFLTEVRNNYGALLYNLDNELHYEYALSKLGGEEHVKNNYPELFQCIKHTKLKNSYPKAEPQSLDGFQDSVIVKNISFNDVKSKANSILSAKYTAPKPAVSLYAVFTDISNPQNPKPVDTVSLYSQDAQELEHTFNELVEHLIGANDKVFRVSATYTWVEEDESNNPVIKSKELETDDTKVIGNTTIVNKVIINDPKLLSANDNKGYINILYNRDANNKEVADYTCDVKPDNNNLIALTIPFSITIRLNDPLRFNDSTISERAGFDLHIEDYANPDDETLGSYYYGDNPSLELQNNNQELNIIFPDDWKSKFKKSDFGTDRKIKLYFSILLKAYDTYGMPSMFRIIVMNNPPSTTPDPSVEPILPIKLRWGCVGKDTMVLMSNYTQKKVSKLNIGDSVLNEENEAIKISNIYTGTEKEIFVITTETNKEVLLTSEHPVLTERGLIRVSEVLLTDKIKTIDGFEDILYLYAMDYNDMVYGLEFENSTGTGHNIICNNIILGDFTKQNNVTHANKSIKQIQYSEQTKKVREEYVRLFCELHKNAYEV